MKREFPRKDAPYPALCSATGRHDKATFPILSMTVRGGRRWLIVRNRFPVREDFPERAAEAWDEISAREIFMLVQVACRAIVVMDPGRA